MGQFHRRSVNARLHGTAAVSFSKWERKAGPQAASCFKNEHDAKYWKRRSARMLATLLNSAARGEICKAEVAPESLLAVSNMKGARGCELFSHSPRTSIGRRPSSSFKPRALLQIAGKTDTHQKVAVQEKTVNDVAELNQCGEGEPWEKKCTDYPSKIGAPVVMYVHPGGHEVPHDAPSIIVTFFKRQYLGRTEKS